MLEMALLVVDGNGMVVFWDVFGHPFVRRGSFVVRPVSRNGSFVAESIMFLHVAAEERSLRVSVEECAIVVHLDVHGDIMMNRDILVGSSTAAFIKWDKRCVEV